MNKRRGPNCHDSILLSRYFTFLLYLFVEWGIPVRCVCVCGSVSASIPKALAWVFIYFLYFPFYFCYFWQSKRNERVKRAQSTRRACIFDRLRPICPSYDSPQAECADLCTPYDELSRTPNKEHPREPKTNGWHICASLSASKANLSFLPLPVPHSIRMERWRTLMRKNKTPPKKSVYSSFTCLRIYLNIE